MWTPCPSSLRNVCTGRYYCPSVAFQMVCDYTRRIHHVSRPFYRATNDITITYNDSYPRDVRIFSTYDREGGLTYWSGAYLICDGGYPKCVCFVDPALTDCEYHSVVWTEWLESVRKDIERLFGALKQRFRWLSHSVEYHHINTLGFGVRVAAILHNRLLKYDNFDKLDWEKMDPNGEEYFEDEDDASAADDGGEVDDSSAVVEVEEEPVSEFSCQKLPDVQDLPAVENNNNAEDPIFPEVQPATNPLENQMADVEEVEELPNSMRGQQQWVFKDSLRKHLSYAYSNGQIQWPKRVTNFQKDAMPILQVIIVFISKYILMLTYWICVSVDGES